MKDLFLLIPLAILCLFGSCLYVALYKPEPIKEYEKKFDEKVSILNEKLTVKTNEFCEKYPYLDFRDISFKWNFEPIDSSKFSQTPIVVTDPTISSFSQIGK